MKKLFFLVMFSSALSFIQAQNQTDEAYIKQIREWFNTTNTNVKICERKTKIIEGLSAEGAEANGYYLQNNLLKLTVLYMGETGKLLHEFYFNEKGLFFFFSQESKYDTNFSDPNVKISNVVENRFYFREGKMILWKEDKVVKANVNSQEYKDKASEILLDAIEMQKKLEEPEEK